MSKTRKLLLLGSIIFLLIILVLYGLGSGLFTYAAAFVRCGGQPVAATRFTASYSYTLPGEYGYGPSLFNEYYCTQAQAEAAGFSPSPFTETGEKQEREFEARYEQQTKFNPAKIDYVAYAPDMERFSYGDPRFGYGDLNNQTFYDLKKDGTIVAQVRQGKVGDEYELCNELSDNCETVGTDSQGREVRREFYDLRDNSESFSLSIRIGGTFINFEGARGDFTIQEAIDVFGSMKPIGEAGDE